MTTMILSMNNNGISKGWEVEELVNGKPSPQLMDLFGTHILPTSFTDSADANEVLATIQRLNPTAIVILK